jgi:Arf-GAP/GTPase/ANK repeat/PH domain-containing protein 1/3
VKIPGQRPRGSEAPKTVAQTNGQLQGSTGQGAETAGPDSLVISNSSLASGFSNGSEFIDRVSPAPLGNVPPPATTSASSTPPTVAKADLPSVKKRPKRAKGGAKGDGAAEDSDGFEFMVVSLDNSTWHFEAQSQEERDEWVTAIEQQILSSLQLNLSDKSKSRSAPVSDRAVIQTIRSVRGNAYCADCDAPNPDWASLNLGVLVCIECSGIHRNLGTHLSRVRSLDLDEWPSELVVTMTSIGNQIANSVWEANLLPGRSKPHPTSSREEKAKWVRAKYEDKEFLPPPPYLDVAMPQQLMDAVARQDVRNTILVLAHCKPDHINTPYSKTDTRTALHIAAALGNLVLVQLLLWYGANTKAIDHEGHSALYYARGAGAAECVELLRTQGCPENPTLPRRRVSNPPMTGGSSGAVTGRSGATAGPGSDELFDKLPASVI